MSDIKEGQTATHKDGRKIVFRGGQWVNASGGSRTSGFKAEANDRKGVMEASERADAAGKSLRLYDSVTPAIERFDPGPLKGAMYDMVMPNSGGGFLDSLGSVVGAPVRALLPSQSKDDYQRIDSARAERIGLRSLEQKGVMAKNDEIQFKAADIGPGKSTKVNRDIIARQRTESLLTRQRSYLHSKWVARYGSTSRASPNGTTFEQAVQEAESNFRNRTAPPSTRKKPAPAGWTITRIK